MIVNFIVQEGSRMQNLNACFELNFVCYIYALRLDVLLTQYIILSNIYPVTSVHQAVNAYQNLLLVCRRQSVMC